MTKEAMIGNLKLKECDSILEFLFNDSKEQDTCTESLEEASKLKVRASISHEIKNPLNCIIAYAELLKKNSSQLHEELKRYVENICTSSFQLKCLLLDIIENAKLEYGKINVKRQCFETRHTIEDVLKVFREQFEERNISLFPVLMQANIISDLTKFNQILYNLVSNAVKFTNKGGSIDVTSWVQDDRFYFGEAGDDYGAFPESYAFLRMGDWKRSDGGRRGTPRIFPGKCHIFAGMGAYLFLHDRIWHTGRTGFS